MSGAENLHSLETVILLLLLMVAVFAVVALKLKVPYPIVLVLAGLAISFSPRMPHVPLEPSVVFLIFLPPLLFSSAWQTSWRDFRHNLVLIGLLAFGLVGFTVWGVAEFSDRFIEALDWKAGFLLGAVMSTTDAIAATSIAKQIGLPRRIVDILEGESMLNDATGLLALEIGLAVIARGDLPTFGEGLARLLYLVAGGLGIGLLIGVVVAWVENFIDNGPVEMVVSLIVPYGAYLAGEKARASGVLAVVACGLYMSRKSATYFSPQVRLQVTGAWNALTFVLNGLVFVLIGMQLPYVIAAIRGKYAMWTLVEYGAVFSAMLIALRMVWVYPAVKIAERLGRWRGNHDKPLNRPSIFVIGWTGMRGVLALAAAISVPEVVNGQPFGPRNLILFLSFSVILVTLVLQGLTLPSVIRVLGLAGVEGKDQEEMEARRIVVEAAVKYLEDERKECTEEHSHVFNDLLDRYRHKLEHLAERENGAAVNEHVYRHLLEVGEGAVNAERQALLRLQYEGRINDDVMRAIERELDLEDSRYRTLRT